MRISSTALTAALVALLFSLASCETKFDWSWNKPAAAQPRVVQPDKTATEDRAVPPFTMVRLEGLGKLVFDPTVAPGTIRVTGDRSLLANVKTEVSEGTLVLKEENVHGFEAFQLEYRTAAPAGLAGLTLAGLGSVESAGTVKTGDLTVSLEGMGKVNLDLVAGAVALQQQGQGELKVSGTAAKVEIRASGLGRVDAGDLKAPAADVENSGVGEVRVFASKSLKVRASGIGAVHFLGHPAQTDVQTEGLTKVSAGD